MRGFYPFWLAIILVSVLSVAGSAQQGGTTPAGQPQTQPQTPDLQEAPVTVKTHDSGTKKVVGDPMGVPALPQGKTSLIGGNVAKVDTVHNKLNVKIFGGGKWDLAFDERTHFYRDGQETTFENIKKGDRVYVDTMLDGHRILARNVRVMTTSGPADARGQVLSVNGSAMSIRDELSSQPLRFVVDEKTLVKRDGGEGSLSNVQAGSLIAVRFAPSGQYRGVAREITLLASPGENFTFVGKVMHLDLRNGLLAVENRTDSKTYDIAFDRQEKSLADLMVGSEITVDAVFDGRQYRASRIDVDKPAE